MNLLDIFTPGKLNFVKEEEGFVWENILVESQLLGFKTYLIFGNLVPIRLRMLYSMLYRMGKNGHIHVRRGFTYHQLVNILLELEKYYDLLIFFHDPVSFNDLRGDEKHSLLNTVALLIARYASNHNSICIFSSQELFKFPVEHKVIRMREIEEGWRVESEGKVRIFYRDPRQSSLDYFMEV